MTTPFAAVLMGSDSGLPAMVSHLAGAVAAHLAAQILALQDADLAGRMLQERAATIEALSA